LDLVRLTRYTEGSRRGSAGQETARCGTYGEKTGPQKVKVDPDLQLYDGAFYPTKAILTVSWTLLLTAGAGADAAQGS